jgi:hypothetical protein
LGLSSARMSWCPPGGLVCLLLDGHRPTLIVIAAAVGRPFSVQVVCERGDEEYRHSGHAFPFTEYLRPAAFWDQIDQCRGRSRSPLATMPWTNGGGLLEIIHISKNSGLRLASLTSPIPGSDESAGSSLELAARHIRPAGNVWGDRCPGHPS